MQSNSVQSDANLSVGNSTVSRRRWCVVAGFLAALCALGAVVWKSSSPAPEPPTDAVAQSDGWADERQCADCHSEAESFHLTGHANTLQRAADPGSIATLKQFEEAELSGGEATRIEVADGQVRAVHVVDGSERELRLDWCFGSGEHAKTWVGTLSDSWGATDLVEFRWTWYHQSDGFAITPGQPANPPEGYFQGLGVLYDHPKTLRCFACHAAVLPEHEGRIQQDAIHAGVTCQRCHGPRKRHVESAGEVTDGFWRNATRMESVNRCAQCHRRADEMKPEEVNMHNFDVVRFQPVGLVQSPCFKASPAMTCVTCHDPHRPPSAQDSLGIWQCVQCHDAAKPNETSCAAGHVDDCLSCHMPKVQMEAPLKFTDHWIRVRE